jgi:predicted phage terminase large subunit-like protein
MPSAAGGMIIHTNWLQRYDDNNPPPDTSYTIVSWDFPQKGSATSSWVVGSVWGVECPDDPYMRRFVLKEVVRAHLDYPGMKRAVERLSIRYPEADLTIVEDKAAGPHLITELKHKIPTIVPFLPDKFGDKEQRLKSVSPVFEAGKVFVPASGGDEPEWLQEYLNEITRFPKYATDDQVDSTTQCMLACMHRLPDLMNQVGTASMQIYDLEW